MHTERIFQIAFALSLAAHSAVIFQNINSFNIPLPREKENRKGAAFQVVYVKQRSDFRKPPAMSTEDALLNVPVKIGNQRSVPLPQVDKDRIFGRDNSFLKDLGFLKPGDAKPDIISIKKKITLPPIDANKIKSPTYLSYYQYVREKIRRAAYQNFSKTETGEVYLSFVVSATGALRETIINEDKSSKSSYLRQISLRSLRDSEPFPNFPKDLDYPQLSFNVIISYQIE